MKGWGFLRILFIVIHLNLLNASVLKITDQNRNQILSNSHHSLIFFTKDNCPRCIQFKPIYDQLSDYYDNSQDFQILQCDSSHNRRTKRVFGVSSFPTVMLYDSHSKMNLKFDQTKNLINLINFVNDHTDAINHEIESKVNMIELMTDMDFTSDSVGGGNNIIVLSLSYLPEWEEYEFPTHEYQQLSYKYPDIKFHLVFVDLVDDINPLLSRYKISNFPSVVYFDGKSDRFKVYKTLSSEHTNNDKLVPSQVSEFLRNLADEDSNSYGQWFKDVDSLNEYVLHQQYEYVDQRNYGFNIRQHGRVDSKDDDVVYEEMVDRLDI